MGQHLLHIGYPKSGSTFLQKWFELHPQLCYKHGGLGGFYNAYEVARPLDKSYKYFVTSCEGFSMPHETTGDVQLIHSGKVDSEHYESIKENQAKVCDVLKSLYPGSGVIIVTRGFESMILSSYSQSLRMGSVHSLKEMCAQLAERLQDDGQHYFDYNYLVGIYNKAFGEHNVIVLPYELLRDDQNKFLRVLEEKLGLEPAEMPQTRINASLSPHELYWYPVISQKVADLSFRLGPKAFRKIYTWYIRRTLDNKFRKPIKVLQRIQPQHQIKTADFPAGILELCRGKATSLKEHPLYAPYAADYLWDE